MNPRPKEKWKQATEVMPVQEYRTTFLSQAKKKNKFNAKKAVYNGTRYDSGLEARVAEQLDFLLKAGELVEVKRQVKTPLMVNGVLICTYYCDFRTVSKHGQVKYVEAKGMEMPVWQIKKKLFLALLQQIDPGAEFEMIKA